MCSAFIGRIPLTLCIIIKKITNLSKPHPPLVMFRTFQSVLPKAVIFKHDFETWQDLWSYFKEVAKNSQDKINFIFKKQHVCHMSFGGFKTVIVDVRKLNNKWEAMGTCDAAANSASIMESFNTYQSNRRFAECLCSVLVYG